MTRVLITGMSGTDKLTALADLARRAHRVVNADLRIDGAISAPETLLAEHPDTSAVNPESCLALVNDLCQIKCCGCGTDMC